MDRSKEEVILVADTINNQWCVLGWDEEAEAWEIEYYASEKYEDCCKHIKENDLQHVY